MATVGASPEPQPEPQPEPEPAAALERQLSAVEEQLADSGNVYDLLEGVQLDRMLDDPEHTTRLYLSLVRIHRALHRRHSKLRTATVAPQPELEPEPELRTTSRSMPSRMNSDASAENSADIGTATAFQNTVHPCTLDTTSKLSRRDTEVSSHRVPTEAPDPRPGANGCKAKAGEELIPRLQLGASLLGHDASSGPRTRSSRRLSARSTRGTPNNTGRSLRSVRLQLQDDTVRPPTVGTGLHPSIQCAPSATRQLQLVATRAAGVFIARRSAGMMRNMRERHPPNVCQATQRLAKREPDQPWTSYRSQRCVVDLMASVTQTVLHSSSSGARCVLDMDVVQLPVNVLVADLMTTAHAKAEDDAGASASYRTAVLRLCSHISSIVDVWAHVNDVAAATQIPPASDDAHSNRATVLGVLPGGTAPDETTPMRSVAVVSTKGGPGARSDRFILRVARILKGLANADMLDHHHMSRCLSLLTDYIKLLPDRRARDSFRLIEKLLRQIVKRTLHGPTFDASVHLNSVEVVHHVLRLSDLMLEPSADWLFVERRASSWICAYCSWMLTGDVGLSEVSHGVEQMQSQAIRYITRYTHAWVQQKLDGASSIAAHCDEVSATLIRTLISSALGREYTASTTTGFECAKAVLELLAEVTLAGQHLNNVLQYSLPMAVHCACTIFLRAYFQPTASRENETLCCTAIETILRLLEVDSRCAAGQVERLRLIDVIVGEISGEHLFERTMTSLSFAVVSGNRHTNRCDGLVSDNAHDDIESDDEGYGSELSSSIDSRYSAQQGDSYSCSEDFTVSAPATAAMPSLQLSGLSAGVHVPGALPANTESTDSRAAALASTADADADKPAFLNGRRIYESDELHLLVLQLIMALVVTPDGFLSQDHWSRTPAAEGKPNLHELLYDHLNHPRNGHLIAELKHRVLGTHSGKGGECLLKLLCADAFDASRYTDRTRLASGANATVYRCNIIPKSSDGSHLSESTVVALKVIDRSSSANHFCPLPDVFSEIMVLMQLRGCEGTCQLIDYGVGSDSYYIALKCYSTSLRKWRLHQDSRSDLQHHSDLLPLYLRIYRRILSATVNVMGRSIIHFDIKCDNILMSPTKNDNLAEFWNPMPGTMPQCDVVLADFGVGKLVGQNEGTHTVRNRGTECIKSPEMILADSASNKAHPSYDRRRTDGSTSSSDVWSLGCLLYELVTGKFLFDDNDFSRFFARVCSESGEPIITDSDRDKLKDPRLSAFLEFVLVRNPAIRPSIDDVCRRFDTAFAETLAVSQWTD